MVKIQSERYQCNKCPQVLKDLKSLQIHQFVDHHHEPLSNSSPSRGPLPTSIVTSIPRAPPPQAISMYPRQSLGSIPHGPIPGVRTSFSHGPPHIPQRPPPTSHFSNGHGPLLQQQHGSMSREGSVSSDSGEGGPLSPALKCELCGLSNFPSTKALQQVNNIFFLNLFFVSNLLQQFVPCSKFLPGFITCFPTSLEQEQCLKKVTNFQPSASNLAQPFSQHIVADLKNLENKYLHFKKVFSLQI